VGGGTGRNNREGRRRGKAVHDAVAWRVRAARPVLDSRRQGKLGGRLGGGAAQQASSSGEAWQEQHAPTHAARRHAAARTQKAENGGAAKRRRAVARCACGTACAPHNQRINQAQRTEPAGRGGSRLREPPRKPPAGGIERCCLAPEPANDRVERKQCALPFLPGR